MVLTKSFNFLLNCLPVCLCLCQRNSFLKMQLCFVVVNVFIKHAEQRKIKMVPCTTLASSNGKPVPPLNLFWAAMLPIQSIVCFIQICICSGEAILLPSSWRIINTNSSIFLNFNCQPFSRHVLEYFVYNLITIEATKIGHGLTCFLCARWCRLEWAQIQLNTYFIIIREAIVSIPSNKFPRRIFSFSACWLLS